MLRRWVRAMDAVSPEVVPGLDAASDQSVRSSEDARGVGSLGPPSPSSSSGSSPATTAVVLPGDTGFGGASSRRSTSSLDAE